ncbi:galactose-specific lectin nattectin-like [Anabas testudineus]|uniref:galactose-specific lectin nattectin-like n=1 Tax=Anabas testudineus TaxID=64144 RepID=UPI000E4597D4|nr:galactose-specific lectin nattectin-like [Anabas testudineus]
MAPGLHFIVVLCLTSGLWFGADANCIIRHAHPGWSQFGGKSFQFFNNPLTWSEAERFCISVGGHLAALESPATYHFIRQVIFRATNTYPETWVGGTDGPNEGAWLWIGGPRFAFINWGPGEPNGGRAENCIEINLGGRDYVNDSICDLKKPFVCVKHPH